MSIIRPFKAYRPQPNLAKEVAARPYDVLNSDEARIEVKDSPLSYLHVGKPEVDIDPSVSIYDPSVYLKGKENLWNLINNGTLVEDKTPSLYIYSLTMDGRTQNGLVCCSSVADYVNDVIKKHEYTRPQKEADRCEHVRVTNAHTGPIFLTYRDNQEVNAIVANIQKNPAETDFVAVDGIRHQVWPISDAATIEKLVYIFGAIPNLYVADGHHRSAAAAIVGSERAKANPNHKGDEEYNYFLAVLFPSTELYIMDYNRLVKDLNGHSEEAVVSAIGKHFTITKADGEVKPARKGEYGLYLAKSGWYRMQAQDSDLLSGDPVSSLDVSILQKYVLDEILDIKDPRTSERIDFVGGIRGIGELVKRVDSGEMAAAIVLFPTGINELMDIADSGNVMPPKSTWFEPKLRDGLFTHFLD